MTQELSIQNLLRKVRKEDSDPNVKEELEYRLMLWFETLCIFYYGENNVSKKEQIFDIFSREFTEKFTTNGKTANLIPFAYDIVKTHIHEKDPLSQTHDLPEDKISIALLKSAFEELTTEEQRILEKFYSPTYKDARPQSSVECIDALKARESLKAMLSKDKNTNFEIILNSKDAIPILFYEGQSFKNSLELERFEKWLINAPDCCTDICDFDRFAKILCSNEIFMVEETQQKIQIPTNIDIEQPELGTDIDIEKTLKPMLPPPPEQESDLGKLILIGVLSAGFLFALWIISSSVFGS